MAKSKKSVTLVPATVIPMVPGDVAKVKGEPIHIALVVTINPDGRVTAQEDDRVRASNETLMTEGLMPIDKALIRIARAVKRELVGE